MSIDRATQSQSERRSRSVSRPHRRGGGGGGVYPAACTSSSSSSRSSSRAGGGNRRRSARYQRFTDSESALTDDDDTHSNNNAKDSYLLHNQIENPTGGAPATQLYQVMPKQPRHAVHDIRTQIQLGMQNVNHSILDDDTLQSTNSDVLQAVSVIRKNYTAKLEQSEKRKQDLLAAIVAEEQRGRELSKIVKELLPDPKNTSLQEKPSLSRQSNDRSWMSKCLSEDAEKYFDDFLSNVEETDISSFDGERSDASSSIGMKKPRDLHSGERETTGLSAGSVSLPVEMDGVVLPWLQWETSNDGSPLLCKNRVDVSVIPEHNLCSSAQGETQSCGSWPGVVIKTPVTVARKIDEYLLHVEATEEIIFEAWRQRQKIICGAFTLCSRNLLDFL